MDRRDKLIKTNIIKYGSYENYVKFLKEIASKGGKNSPGGGFRDKEVARKAGITSAKRRRQRANQRRANELT